MKMRNDDVSEGAVSSDTCVVNSEYGCKTGVS